MSSAVLPRCTSCQRAIYGTHITMFVGDAPYHVECVPSVVVPIERPTSKLAAAIEKLARAIEYFADKSGGVNVADAWQPIETAPKDGTEFIAHCECGDYWMIRWCPNEHEPAVKAFKNRGFYCAGKAVGEAVVIPCLAHWMPLPPPPPAEGEEM